MIYIYDESKFAGYINDITNISGNINKLSSNFSSAFSSCEIPKIRAAANSVVRMMNAMNGNWKNVESTFGKIKNTYKNCENGLISGNIMLGEDILNRTFNNKEWELPDYELLYKGEISTNNTYKGNDTSNSSKPISIDDVVKNGRVATTRQNAKEENYVKAKLHEKMFEGATIRSDGLIIAKDGKTALGWTNVNIESNKIEKKVNDTKVTKDHSGYKNERYKTPNSGEYTAKEEQKKAKASQSEVGNQVVNEAVKYVGNPYVYGGTSLTNGIDCSGFTMKIYEKQGVNLPHSSAAQRNCGTAVNSLKEAKPGDLICYDGHVAIYMGDNKIVHASNPKSGIKISNNASYRPILAIRRIIT